MCTDDGHDGAIQCCDLFNKNPYVILKSTSLEQVKLKEMRGGNEKPESLEYVTSYCWNSNGDDSIRWNGVMTYPDVEIK